MNTVLLNISAYAFMTVVMALIFKLSTKHGGILVFLNFMLFAWSAFMAGYLMVDYHNIISSPLNERLNFYETITNILWPLNVFIFYLNLIYKKS
jgi:ABC-type branched-subunit amino acid transport system permease subunit